MRSRGKGATARARWCWAVVLAAQLLCTGAGQAQADPTPANSPAPSSTRIPACTALLPQPWPTTVVERRLHLSRLEASRDACIGDAGFVAALGALWLEDGDPEQALIWLERALMLDPGQPGVLADHALVLAALGEPTALRELAAAWRNRSDVPPALRSRILAALDPQAAMQLPPARLGRGALVPQPARSRSRGEASVLVGHENNLAVSPRLNELTLTPPDEEPIVLPVISAPRRGAALKADLSWQTAWAPAPGNVVRAGLGASMRSAPGESSTDWHQLQGAVGYTRQWNGWSATAVADAMWFGGALTEPYGLLRTRLVLERNGENCSHASQIEADMRRQSSTHSADSLTTVLAWRLQCRPAERRDWQWSLALRASVDRPTDQTRPGGEQHGQGLVLRLEHRPSAILRIDLSLGGLRLSDREGYNPLLENNARRRQTQSFVTLEFSRSLDLRWMPGAEAVLQLTRYQQASNLALFRHDGYTAYTGLRWPW